MTSRGLTTSPEGTLLEFLQASYEAAANCGKWDREALEPAEPWPPHR